MGKQPSNIKQPRDKQPSASFYVVKLQIGATYCVAWYIDGIIAHTNHQDQDLEVQSAFQCSNPTPSITHRPAIQFLESGLLNYQHRPRSTHCSYWVFTVVSSQDRDPQSGIPEIIVGINNVRSELFGICDKNVPFWRAQRRASLSAPKTQKTYTRMSFGDCAQSAHKLEGLLIGLFTILSGLIG